MSIFYPFEVFANFLTYKIFHVLPETRLADVVNYFIYDVLKIFLLLVVIIFVVAILRSFLSPKKIRSFLSRRNEYVGNVLASLIGIITPFCTCSAVPLFLGFIEAGVPLGVTFSFLVASPMINEVAIILLLGMFGWKVALIYIVSGLFIAIFSGIFIGRLKPERLIESFDYRELKEAKFGVNMSWNARIKYAAGYAFGILRKVWIYVVVGIGVGAWIHGYVPADFFTVITSAGEWYAVPVAVILGIPLYSNAAGIIPLVSALVEKGVGIGTALSFMMAVTALSLPEFMILKRIMKVKLIFIFALVIGVGIIFTGYLFNYIL